MVRKFYFIFLMIFIVNCNLFSGKFYMSKQKEQIANCVLNEACSEISHKYGMSCIGSGGAMMYEIESLKLMFCIKKPLEKDEARKIIVDSANIFLKKINNNKDIAKYLIKWPLDLDNIVVSIIFFNVDGTTTYHPQLAAVSIVRGNIRYKTNDRENKWVYKETTEESFEEAKRILEEQKHY